MPNLHRYTSVPMGGVGAAPDSTPSHHRSSLLKWLYRKYIRLWLHAPSWSGSNCLLTLACLFFIFILASTHLYMGLQDGDLEGGQVAANGQGAYYRNGTYHDGLRRFSLRPLWADASKMEAARQIDRQLEKIEASLQENREILKQIRAQIHSAEVDRSAVVDTGNGSKKLNLLKSGTEYLDAIRLKDRLFYLNERGTGCDREDKATAASRFDINMSAVYEELPFDDHDGGVWKQGWDVQAPAEAFAVGKRPKLKIFVVAHSHNDPGWVKTFDTYFREQTKGILTSAVEQMEKDKDVRFIWAEASYLSAWWETAPTQEHRDLMKQYIKEGRLELVTGGWVMNDEANTHYSSMLAQMIEGHEWLQDTFQVTLRHGWAIDPFGLSPTMAYLLKRMGFRAMVIQRVHYTIKKYLAKRKQLEFRWRQHWEDSETKDILCHIEPFYSYDIPHTCGPNPAVCCQFDFKRLPGNRVKCPWKIAPRAITVENVEERAKVLLDQYRKKSQLYKTNVLLVPLGDDFRYDKAKEWTDQFGNYKKLMEYMNGHEEMNVEIKFGTLADYFDALFLDTGVISNPESTDHTFDQTALTSAFPSLVGDFFTYSDREDHYWSGYYTSKPFYKRFERILEAHLRATEILFAIANMAVAGPQLAAGQPDPFEPVVNEFVYARQNAALFQHHDGITGTAKDFVVKDYAKRMHRSFTILEQVASASLQAIAANASGQVPFDLKKNPVNLEFMERFPNEETPLRKRVFQLGAGAKYYFILYNSLGWPQESQLFCFTIAWATGPMPTNWCLAEAATGRIVEDIQINHQWSTDSSLLPGQRQLCFQPRLDPVSLEQYCIGDCGCHQGPGGENLDLAALYQKKESFVTLYNYHEGPEGTDIPTDSHILAHLRPPPVGGNLTIENERIQLSFDSTSGLLKRISMLDPHSGTPEWLHLDATARLMTYGTRKGGKTVPKSGAYLFLPDEQEAKPWTTSGRKLPKMRLTTGRLEARFELILQEPLSMYISFSLVRGRRSADLVTEFHLAGLYAANRELLMRFELPAIKNYDHFTTDLNGFQLITRKWYNKIPLQGNVYPLNTMAFIEGAAAGTRTPQNLRFTILTGQPLGVTSSASGRLDVFLDRRLMQDDARGLNQGVIDNKKTTEQFRLLLEMPQVPVRVDSPKASSAAMFESVSLLNPVLGLTRAEVKEDDNQPSEEPPGPILNPSTSLHYLRPHSLSCDVHLLGLRRATKRPAEIALLLHRFGLSCDSTCTSTTNSASANISLTNMLAPHLLAKLQPDRLLPRGISLLEPEAGAASPKAIPFSANLSIGPNEIVAFKMYLKT